MDTAKSLEIIRALANGVDPHTGEEYAVDSPYQHPQTIRALFMAIQALERTKKADDRQRQLPDNAGKAWLDEEDHRLVAAFDSGKTTKQLAEEHQRTESSIRSRLVKHGKIQL
jgi:DNA-binding NarL/FixJ family response regulator